MSYKHEFLNGYVPNQNFYVPKKVQQDLLKQGNRLDEQLAAGTYARQICQRLPIGNQHTLKELFELVLQKAKKIENPFEQSFFLLVHLSYLQAFKT